MKHQIIRVFSYAALLLGISAIVQSLTGEEFNGYALIGGSLFVTQACIALWYAGKFIKWDRQDELAEAIRASQVK